MTGPSAPSDLSYLACLPRILKLLEERLPESDGHLRVEGTWLTIPEAAARWNFDQQTIRRWCRNGDIECKKRVPSGIRGPWLVCSNGDGNGPIRKGNP